jgi:hypothetical protein
MMEIVKKSRATWKLEVKKDKSATSITTNHTKSPWRLGFGFLIVVSGRMNPERDCGNKVRTTASLMLLLTAQRLYSTVKIGI